MSAPVENHPLWREFKDAEAALDAAYAGVDGPLPDTHPAWPRWQAARDAIVNARPLDLAGLAVQLRLFNEVFIASDPNEDERRMLAYVGEQMAAMAAQQLAA
jgi:hypothetical protein